MIKLNSKFTVFALTFTLLTISACKKDNQSDNNQSTPTISVTTDNEQITPKSPTINTNFEVNDYFETFISKNKTGEAIVNINKPVMNGELLRKADKVKVEINGYWVSDSPKNEITLEIYPNYFEADSDNRAIIKQKLKLNRQNRFLTFSYLKMIALEEGLYYYFLKDDDHSIYTGKFVVK